MPNIPDFSIEVGLFGVQVLCYGALTHQHHLTKSRKKRVPKHPLSQDLYKTTLFDKEPNKSPLT
ncbi:hypothetical protein, partial [Enterococcus italicus]|uniref:hypothetical protein n=1 Tax=Enterococcus italicus TaxID=246144 RepID=UPI003F488B91